MKVEIWCPKCGRGYLVEPEKAATARAPMTCLGCGTSLRVPGFAQASSQRPAAASTPRPAARASAPPATTRTPTRPASATAASTSGSGAGEGVQCPRCGFRFSPKTSQAPAEGGRRCRVLVVEDMPFFQESVREVLSERYELLFASNVAAARRAIETETLDLLLLDLTLEGGEDGLALLRALPRKPCPVLIYTSEDEAEVYGDGWQSLRALGADDVVLKGMNAGEALARKVAEILGKEPPPETGWG